MLSLIQVYFNKIKDKILEITDKTNGASRFGDICIPSDGCPKFDNLLILVFFEA